MDLVGLDTPYAGYQTMSAFAQLAEKLGFSSIWLYDHVQTVPRSSQEMLFECWTTTAALARDTQTIRIGQLVTCNSYRNPALLAKMASCVDVLSNGRLNFGIGAGCYEEEYIAYGYDFPDAPTQLKQLHEAVQIILLLWTQPEVSFAGKFYHIKNAINQPHGIQVPHIPLLIGGSGEKVTLKLVAQYANACNIASASPEEVARKFAILEDYCHKIRRDYNTIHKTVLLNCSIDNHEVTALQRAIDTNFARNAKGEDFIEARSLVGRAGQIREKLKAYENVGVAEVILYFPQPKRIESIYLFANEVMGKM